MLKPLEMDANEKKKSRDMSCFSNCSQFIEKRGIWLNNGNRIEVAELEMSPRSHIALVGRLRRPLQRDNGDLGQDQ